MTSGCVRGDRGSASFFAVAVAMVALAGVGLLTDTARLFAARRAASSTASAAARSGAMAFDPSALAVGRRVLDPVRARSNALVAADGAGATVVVGCGVAGCDRVTVTVTQRVALVLLGQRTVSAAETARVVTGVLSEGG